MKKKFLWIGLLVVGVVLYLTYSQFNRKVESVEQQKVEVNISAEELLDHYAKDENSANAKFLDKVIQVEGEIIDIEIGEDIKAIFLDAGNDLSRIICQLDDSVQEIPTKGERVKVKGICTGYLMDVIIVRAIIQN